MTTAACLVLDIGLPGLSGFELYQRLIKTGAKLPVIFITAGSERAREVGAIAYLLKPVPKTKTTGRDYSSPQFGKGTRLPC
jgi:FixJ family two-component response regulator